MFGAVFFSSVDIYLILLDTFFVQSESSDGEKMVNLDDPMKREKIGVCPVTSVAIFIFRLYHMGIYTTGGGRDIPLPWFKAKFWRYFKLGADSSLPNFYYQKD